jgi:[phosphatase 2A protein]-leucine-carboxy methyltransferase
MGNVELQRIAKLELLDEVEEWRLLANHYCIAWAWKKDEDSQNAAFNIFDDWRDIKGMVA